MAATEQATTLSRNDAKRGAQLAERFAAAGYRFLDWEASGTKYIGGLTRYVLSFDRPERERWDLLPGFNQRHWLNFDGFEALDEGTGDTALLANLCALVRHRRYDRVISEIRFASGWRTTIQKRVAEARAEYGGAASSVYMLSEGYGEHTSDTLAQARTALATAGNELSAVLADAKVRLDLLAGIAPAVVTPTGKDWHRWYAFEKAQPTFDQ